MQRFGEQRERQDDADAATIDAEFNYTIGELVGSTGLDFCSSECESLDDLLSEIEELSYAIRDGIGGDATTRELLSIL